MSKRSTPDRPKLGPTVHLPPIKQGSRSTPKISSKKKVAKKAVYSRAGSLAKGRSEKPARAGLALVHDLDREAHFRTFGRLTSQAREALIARGLPARFLAEAQDALGVSRAGLLEGLGIASSTAARVRQQERNFSPGDSERLALLARLWDQVLMVYEDEAGARAWLTGKVPSAGGVPLQMLKTHEGFERAQRSILQLAYGVPG